MSVSKWGTPWSDDPYAPQIPFWLYFAEKTNYAGYIIGSIIYGLVVVQFFRCMDVFFGSAKKRSGSDWAILAYVGALFTFGTVYTATNLNLQSVSYVNNRNFPGNDDFPPGPLGYQWSIHASGLSIVPNLMFMLSSWLADGLLIYRCFFIYSMNYAIIVLPCLVLLGSFSAGLWFTFQTTLTNGAWNFFSYPGTRIGLPYFTVSAGLNVILSVMILVRLVLYSKSDQNATTTPARTRGLWSTLLATCIESGSLYAISSLLFIIPWGAKSYVANIFLPVLAQTQVIVPLLIVLQAIGKSSAASDRKQTASGGSGSSGFASQRRPSGNNPPGVYSGSSVNLSGKPHQVRYGIGVETTVDLHRDKV